MQESCGTGERAGRLASVRRIACRPARPNDAPRGLANPFAVCVPSLGQRRIHAGGRRTRIDRAHCGRHPADIDDPDGGNHRPDRVRPDTPPSVPPRVVLPGEVNPDRRWPRDPPHAQAGRPAHAVFEPRALQRHCGARRMPDRLALGREAQATRPVRRSPRHCPPSQRGRPGRDSAVAFGGSAAPSRPRPPTRLAQVLGLDNDLRRTATRMTANRTLVDGRAPGAAAGRGRHRPSSGTRQEITANAGVRPGARIN